MSRSRTPAETRLADSRQAAGSPPSREVVVAWVRRHQRQLIRYLRVLGADETLAQDLAQECFLAAFRAGVQDRGPGPAASWLRETGRRLFLAAGRKARRAGESVDPVVVDQLFSQWQDRDGGQAWQDALRACLDGLPDRTRGLVQARYAEGLSRKELGQRLELSEAGVKQALRRARAALKHCVLERLGDDVPARWREEEEA